MQSPDPLETLNPQQREAATHGTGDSALDTRPLMVIAGAGSGKTNTLAHRVANLIRHGADSQRMMLLTFSRRAAQEMERRVGGVLQMKLVEQLASLMVEQAKVKRAIQTAILLHKAQAARDIICPGWAQFHPLSPGMTITGNFGATAYDAYMDGGGTRVGCLEDAQAIAEATAKLAQSGLDEEALLDKAYVLALPSIERLEKVRASQAGEQEVLAALDHR